MADTADASTGAGERFRTAAGLAFEDARLRRFRYHLRRLSLAGLTDADERDLRELGRAAFQDLDVADLVARIRQRPDAGPLVSAIADVLATAGIGVRGPVPPSTVLLGAVLGAYTSLTLAGEADRPAAAVSGAVSGAVALGVGSVVLGTNRDAWPEYSSPD